MKKLISITNFSDTVQIQYILNSTLNANKIPYMGARQIMYTSSEMQFYDIPSATDINYLMNKSTVYINLNLPQDFS